MKTDTMGVFIFESRRPHPPYPVKDVRYKVQSQIVKPQSQASGKTLSSCFDFDHRQIRRWWPAEDDRYVDRGQQVNGKSIS